MRDRICCGLGHRVLLMDIEKPLREVLERLVKEQGVTDFFTGGMGEFDELYARVVRSMKRNDPRLRLVLVIPYLTRRAATEKVWYQNQYDEILIPAELDGVHPKAAITLRNHWMVITVILLSQPCIGISAARRSRCGMRKRMGKRWCESESYKGRTDCHASVRTGSQ